MARALTIEEESGTFTRRLADDPHHGYYAGDFSGVPFHDPFHGPRRVVSRRSPRRATHPRMAGQMTDIGIVA